MRLTLEQKLAQLAALENDLGSERTRRELRKALSGSSNVLVALAARLAAKAGLTDATLRSSSLRSTSLMPDLADAFGRFMEQGEKRDKGCRAKVALVQALNALGCDDADVFLRGIRHVQMEPVWGGRVDTAADLRCECASGLLRIGDPDVLFELVTLLMDPETQPRRAAVQALTRLASEVSELLLRFKALAGDAEPDVIADCFAGLMAISPRRSVPFVARYLGDADPVVAEGAALALGGSRCPEAFEALRACWQNSLDARLKTSLLLPIALVRSEESFAFLLNVIREEHRDKAIAALKALKVYAGDARGMERIREAVAFREERPVTRVCESEFGKAPP